MIQWSGRVDGSSQVVNIRQKTLRLALNLKCGQSPDQSTVESVESIIHRGHIVRDVLDSRKDGSRSRTYLSGGDMKNACGEKNVWTHDEVVNLFFFSLAGGKR